MRRWITRTVGLSGLVLLMLTGVMMGVHRQAPTGFVVALADQRYQGGYVVRVEPDGRSVNTLLTETELLFSALTVNPDHTAMTLTALHGADLVPSWWSFSLTGTLHQHDSAPPYPDAIPAPDGQWVLLLRQQTLYRATPDPRQPLEVIFTQRGFKDNLAWSHDGQWVLLRLNESSPTLYRVRPDGSEASPIVPTSAAVSQVVWSPINDWVVYSVQHEAATGRSADLYRVRIDGSDNQRLNAATLPPVSRLAGSPDGAWVLVMTADSSGAGIERGLWRLSTNDWTLTPVPLTTRSLLIDELGWSPDNHALAVVSWGSLYRLDLDTGHLVTLHSAYLIEHRSPVWVVPLTKDWHGGGLALLGVVGVGLALVGELGCRLTVN